MTETYLLIRCAMVLITLFSAAALIQIAGGAARTARSLHTRTHTGAARLTPMHSKS